MYASLLFVCMLFVKCMHLCLLCGSSENVAYILHTNCKLVSEFQEVQSSDVQVKHECTIRDMPAELSLHIIALRDSILSLCRMNFAFVQSVLICKRIYIIQFSEHVCFFSFFLSYWLWDSIGLLTWWIGKLWES
jgi:hypothetical protein